MTSHFLVLRAFLQSIFNSYQSQFLCIFGQPSLLIYGNSLRQINVFYCSKDLVNQHHLCHFIQVLSSHTLRATLKQKTAKKIVFIISRISSPVLDSQVLARYLQNITPVYNFQQICTIMIKRIMLNTVLNAHGYASIQPQGLLIKLHGRSPREAVRPRKTIQSRILGCKQLRSYVLRPKNIAMRSELGLTPELGTFSLWVSSI